MDSKKNQQSISKFIYITILFYFVFVLNSVYEAYLAYNGLPSIFDYQTFKLTMWINTIIPLIFIAGYLISGKKINNDSLSWKYYLLFLFFSGVLIDINEERINQFKYYLPLVKIETLEIEGRLSKKNYLAKSMKDDELKLEKSLTFEEFPNKHFKLSWRRRLKNEIDNLNKDTFFLEKGKVIKIKVRKSDYNRMVNGQINSSIFLKDKFDGSKIEFYGLEFDGKIIFKTYGLN